MCQISFSLSNDSFVQNGNTIDVIYKNIENLNYLNGQINSFNDLVFRDQNIYYIPLVDGKLIYEILHVPHIEFSQDYKTMLSLIIDRAKDLNGENYQNIGLNKVADLNIIYNESELMEYYYSLIENVHDEEEFYICIKKYFTKLKFQEKVAESLTTLEGDGLEIFAKDIVKSLKCLENEFKDILNESNGLPEALTRFSSVIGLETTPEGNVARKPDFTFKFKKDNEEDIDICCESHIKLSKSSKSGDHTYYYNRLHFYEGRDGIENGKILIGHIGGHL